MSTENITISVDTSDLQASLDALTAKARTLRDLVWLAGLVQELSASLEAVLPYAEMVDDKGPSGEGWKSDELLAKIGAARIAMLKAREIPSW